MIPAGAARHAREVLARHGRSFHFASRFLGRSRAGDCARLYAFCRRMDDLADEGGDPGQAAAELDRVAAQIRSGQATDPVTADFLELARRHSLDLDAAEDLVRGIASDCRHAGPRDQDALLRYAYRVAGTVGLLAAPILGCRHGRGLPHAVDLGIAMQLTNIARDVREDAARGRIYLPRAWIGAVTVADLLAPSAQVKADITHAIDRLLALADRRYESFEHGLRYLPFRSRLAILVAARSYRAIGTRLRQRRPRWWEGRAVVGTAVKCRIAVLEALPRLAAAGRPARHDPPSRRRSAGPHAVRD